MSTTRSLALAPGSTLSHSAPADTGGGPALSLSLVVPAFDEAENLGPLHARILEVFGGRDDWELIVVDDGSRDATAAVLRELALRDARVVGIVFETNCGQTSAIAAGIHVARGALVATLDADLQNDPADLPGLIGRIEGWDAVVGYRVGRRDDFVKRVSSRIANRVRNALSHDSIRDTGCSLKVFRSDAIRSIPWFEGMHRFLPTLLRQRGYSVLEQPVSHHPRRRGKSKYGIRNRVWKSFVDLLAVRWMRRRLIRRPIREVVRAR